MNKLLTLSCISLSLCSLSLYAGGEHGELCYKHEFKTFMKQNPSYCNEHEIIVLPDTLPQLNNLIERISTENQLPIPFPFISSLNFPHEDDVKLINGINLYPLLRIGRNFLLEKTASEVESAIRNVLKNL